MAEDKKANGNSPATRRLTPYDKPTGQASPATRPFIYDSYACRPRKGMHRAMIKAQELLRANDYYLKCDVRSFFFSIDHKILLKILFRSIECEKTMRLIEKIIDSAPNPGLPIGNLTSQLFANVYLNELDHFIPGNTQATCLTAGRKPCGYNTSGQECPSYNTSGQECPSYNTSGQECPSYNTSGQECPSYIRYMDDFVLFGNSKKELWNWKNKIEQFLHEELKLQFNPQKVSVAPYKEGLDFCGYRVFRDRRRLRPQNVRSFRKRLKGIKAELRSAATKGRASSAATKANEKIQSWLAHSSWANTYNLRKQIFGEPRWGAAAYG